MIPRDLHAVRSFLLIEHIEFSRTVLSASMISSSNGHDVDYCRLILLSRYQENCHKGNNQKSRLQATFSKLCQECYKESVMHVLACLCVQYHLDMSFLLEVALKFWMQRLQSHMTMVSSWTSFGDVYPNVWKMVVCSLHRALVLRHQKLQKKQKMRTFSSVESIMQTIRILIIPVGFEKFSFNLTDGLQQRDSTKQISC